MQPREPRCGKPMRIRETAGNADPGRYAGWGMLIRRARLEAGLTQARLAALVGAYGYQIVWKWESEYAHPAAFAGALNAVLGITLPGPACGRREGHKPPCRSARGTARWYESGKGVPGASLERVRAA